MSELKETQKMKVVQLYEYTLKQLSKPNPTPKKAQWDPKNSTMTPKLSKNQYQN